MATGLSSVFGPRCRLYDARRPAEACLQANILRILTLGELEPLPCAGLSGFFSLFHTRIATQ